MGSRPSVARVLLVAHPSRHAQLASWLDVEDEPEPVTYVLDCMAPGEPRPQRWWWDVVVVDGESFPDERARLELLREFERPRTVSVIYVLSRLLLERELEHAALFCDDWTLPDPDRVCRRVQVVALAPWRRERALRLRAQQLGDGRLRVLPRPEPVAPPGGRGPEGRRAGHTRGFVLLEQAYRLGATPQMVAEAFHEGRRAGVTAVAEGAEGALAFLREELARICARLPVEAVEDIEASARARAAREGMRSAIVAARVQGAEGTLNGLEGQLGQVVRRELDAIERREAGGHR